MNEKAQGKAGQDSGWIGRDSQRANRMLAGRRAEQAADFLLPYLHAGMRVLDCGCGPGSITLGLAEIVRPGEVVGIDLEEKYIRQAQERTGQER